MAWENAQIPGSPYYPWSSTGGPVERAENRPQGASTPPPPDNPRKSAQTTAIALPGYGTQCAIIGFQREPVTGKMTNISVMYGGGLTRNFATESEYLSFCGGGGGAAPPYPGVATAVQAMPQAYVQPSQSPQTINISVPASTSSSNDPNFMSYWMAQQAARDADRNALLTALTARTGGGGQVATPVPVATVPAYQYTPSGDVGTTPSAAAEQQMTASTPTSSPLPMWAWLALGAFGIMALSKGRKQ